MSSQFVIRPDQVEAVDNIVDRLKSESRTQAIMACGTGKTFTAQRAAEQIVAGNPDSVILVAVPNLVLVEQLMGEWSRQFSSGFRFNSLAVNSRREEAKNRKSDMDDDEITSVSIDGVTSDPQRISEFMLAPGRKVIFSTYQSMDKISAAAALARGTTPGYELDLVVADEAHRTAGVMAKEQKSVFKLILDGFEVPARKRLFMTATPRISRLENKGDSDTAAASMGNPTVYGERAITRSLSWAVANKLLVPYRTYVTQVSDADLHAIIARNKTLRLDGTAAQARQIAAAISLAKSAAQNDLGGIITYHSSIAGAQEFVTILQAIVEALPASQKPSGKLTINHVNGTTDADDRRRALGTLNSSSRQPGDWSVVTNCNCLVEGVNVPSMDAIMLVDPRSSVVSIVQAIGRPMRTDANKPDKIANILLPVFIGEHEDAEDALNSGAYEGVYQTIKALRDVDDALSEKFIQAMVERSQAPSKNPKTVPVDSSEIVVEPKAADEETGRKPEQGIPLLVITDSEGAPLPGQPSDGLIHVAAPSSAGVIQKPTGEVGQRTAGTFVDQHWSYWHAALETKVIGDNSTWWERGVAAVRAFAAREGHARVPANHLESGHASGEWVSARRMAYKAGRLSTEQIAELEAIPGWVWVVIDESWGAGVAAVRAFAAREGHARVPANHRESGHATGRWVGSRRQGRKAGRLSTEQIAELEAIPGWVWAVDDESWNAGVAAVRAFAAREGHARVPASHRESGHASGGWVSARRIAYKAGRLSTDQIAELEAIPGWVWVVIDENWTAGVAAVRAFAAREGHARVPQRHREGDHASGGWVSRLREAYKADRLSTEQIAELEAIPGWTWVASGEVWASGIAAVRSFAAREGHARVPYSHREAGHATGSWIYSRRSELGKGKLISERIAELDAIDVSWRKGVDPWESAPGMRMDSDTEMAQAA